MTRRVPVALAGARGGAAVAPAIVLLLGGTYRSSAILRVLPAAEEAVSPAGRAPAEVQAATYAVLVADGHYLLRAAGSAEAVPVEVDNDPPRVRLEEPEGYAGRLLLRAEAEDSGSGVASVTFMVSDGSAEWSEVPAEWEPPAPGVWWLCALAADRAGNRASSELVPVRVESL